MLKKSLTAFPVSFFHPTSSPTSNLLLTFPPTFDDREQFFFFLLLILDQCFKLIVIGTYDLNIYLTRDISDRFPTYPL